ALHPSLGVDQCRIATFALAQAFNVIGHLPVQESDTISAGQTETAATAQVQHAGCFSQRRVFARRVSVIADEFAAVKLLESATTILMKLLENQLVHAVEHPPFIDRESNRFASRRRAAPYRKTSGRECARQ